MIAANPVNYGKRTSFESFNSTRAYTASPQHISSPAWRRRPPRCTSPASTRMPRSCSQSSRGATRSGRSTGEDTGAGLARSLLTPWDAGSPILQRYQTCTDPASVLAMQEVMIGEMEQEQEERREPRNLASISNRGPDSVVVRFQARQSRTTTASCCSRTRTTREALGGLTTKMKKTRVGATTRRRSPSTSCPGSWTARCKSRRTSADRPIPVDWEVTCRSRRLPSSFRAKDTAGRRLRRAPRLEPGGRREHGSFRPTVSSVTNWFNRLHTCGTSLQSYRSLVGLLGQHSDCPAAA